MKQAVGQRTRPILALLVMLLLPLGGLAVAGQGKGKASGKGKEKAGRANDDRRRGGIDPTTVPIVDDDLDFAIDPGSIELLGRDVREQLQLDAAHEHATGRDVVVAVLDGGFDLDHPCVATRFLGTGYDAIQQDDDAHDVGNGFDDDLDGIPDAAVGHGTFVAAMVSAVAPDAWILPVRIRDDEGFGTNAETVRGLEFAWQMGVDVVNLSISAGELEDAGVNRTIGAMRRAGIAVVVSLGNDGLVWQNGLAGSRNTLAVGAVDARDHVAPFSNYSLYTWPQQRVVYAPGVDLYGPLTVDGMQTCGWWSGTSFATGIISGAAALALDVLPGLAPLDLYDVLATATEPAWGPAGEDLDGLGRIDLLKVVTP